MSSLYDLVFPQSQQAEEKPDNYDENQISTSRDSDDEDDECPFRLEAREALMKKRKEEEDERRNDSNKKRKGRIFVRPTMYRTEEEKASLKEAQQRVKRLVNRAMTNRWNYFAEGDEDADAADVIFQNMVRGPTQQEEGGTTKKMVPLSRFIGGTSRCKHYTDKPPNGLYWPWKVHAPIWCHSRNPIDQHLAQLSFVTARLLLNACGTKEEVNEGTITIAPTAFTMEAIGHFYHIARTERKQPFSAAINFAKMIIPPSAVNVPVTEEGQSAHDILQHQINHTLHMWRDETKQSINLKKNRHQKKHGLTTENATDGEQDIEQQKHPVLQKQSRRQQRFKNNNMAEKKFMDVSHVTPNIHFLPIFEITLSLLVCIIGEILLLEEQENVNNNRQKYEQEEDENDDIYNVSSLYQQEEEEEGASSSLLAECRSIVRTYFSVCRKHMKERFKGDSKLNLMSFPQYIAVQRNQSFICNSGMMTGSSLADVATELIQVGKDVLNERQLKKIFGDVHVTTGISMIVASLCNLNSDFCIAAAEIVSKSSINRKNDIKRRTPFDVMCLAFRQLFMEESGVSDMVVETLANEIYRASHVFEACWHNDNENVNARLWHLAALLGALLLSSGKLRLIYSKVSSCSTTHDFLGRGARRVSGQVENIKLFLYESVRKEASESFLQLEEALSSNNNMNNNGNLSHTVMSSLLEWTEAIYLLCRTGNSEEFHSITQLHAWHTICWAKEEKTVVMLTRVRQLHRNKIITTNSFLCILADCIEQTPTNFKLWLELMCYLKSSDVEHSLATRNSEKMLWWGWGRSWWQRMFLQFPPKIYGPPSCETYHEDDGAFERFSFLTLETIKSKSSFFAILAARCFAINSTGVDFSFDSTLHVGWLRPPDDERDNLYIEDIDDETNESTQSHGTFRDKLRRHLPQHSSEIMASREEIGTTHNDDIFLQSLIQEYDSKCFCTTLYIKLIIACHLFDTDHCFVQHGIAWLFEQARKQRNTAKIQQTLMENNNSDVALIVLSFLRTYHGLDVKLISRKFREEAVRC